MTTESFRGVKQEEPCGCLFSCECNDDICDQAINLPEVGTVETEDAQGIFEQVWDPIHSFSSDPVAPAADLEMLVADFSGVVSQDKVQLDFFSRSFGEAGGSYVCSGKITVRFV